MKRLRSNALLQGSRLHWQRLAKREQRALLGLMLFFAALLFYQLLWQPQQQSWDTALARFSRVTHEQQLLQQLPTEIAQERISVNELPGLLARSSKQAGLDLERMDNQDSGRIDLALQGSLNSLITWIDQLEQKQVQVMSLSIEVATNALASAQLQVQVL